MDDAVRCLVAVWQMWTSKEEEDGVNKHVSHRWTGSSVLLSLFCFALFCFFVLPKSHSHWKQLLTCIAKRWIRRSLVDRQKRRRDKSLAIPCQSIGYCAFHHRTVFFSSPASVNVGWPLSSRSRYGCPSLLLLWRHFRFLFYQPPKTLIHSHCHQSVRIDFCRLG